MVKPMSRILAAHHGWAILLAAVLAALAACAPEPEGHGDASEVPVRVLLVELSGFVGCGVDAVLLRQPLAEAIADLDEPIDAVVFRFDSGGGMLNRVGPLSDLIHSYFADGDVRCLAWIDRAESSASILALTITELWMPPDGSIGAAVGVRETEPGIWEPLPDEQQEAVRFMVAASAARGGHDADVAMLMTRSGEGSTGPHAGRVFTGAELQDLGLARTAPSLDAALDSVFGAGGWQLDEDRSKRVVAAVQRAERTRSELTELLQRFEAAAETAESDPDSFALADAVLGELLTLSTDDDPAVLRAIDFVGGFPRITRAIDRLETLRDQNTP